MQMAGWVATRGKVDKNEKWVMGRVDDETDTTHLCVGSSYPRKVLRCSQPHNNGVSH
jgi:hypothetical protein